MKNVFLTVLLCVFCAPLFGQIQVGLVREQNSKRKPIPGVQVNFSGAVPTISDDNGHFRLVFQGKKPGDIIFINEIRKSGYELVNEKELKALKISENEKLVVDIILAKAGAVDAAKKAYYDVSDKALLAGFNRKKQELQEQLKNAEISQGEAWDRFKELQDQYDRQKQSLDELAEKFARVNFDDVSEVYRQALELFKEGKIDEAIAKLEEADFLNRSERHLMNRERIEIALDELKKQKEENEEGFKKDLEAMLRQAKMYISNGEPADALGIYEIVMQVAEDNLVVLQTCADFFVGQNRPEKALPLFEKIIAHPEADAEQKSKASQYISTLTQKKD